MTVKKELREQVREWAATPEIMGTSGVVSLDLDTMTSRLVTTRAALKAALDSLSAEEGSGFHKVSGHLYSYRHQEYADAHPPRPRKSRDMQVRTKAYEYMMRQAPNTLHTVQEVATAIKAINPSTSAALRYMVDREFIPVSRESKGIYRRLPGQGVPGTEIPEDEDVPLTPEQAREYQEDHEAGQRARWVPAPVAQILDTLPTEPRSDFQYSGRFEPPPAFEPQPGLVVRAARSRPPEPALPAQVAEEERPAPKRYGRAMRSDATLDALVADRPGHWDDSQRLLYMLPPTRSGLLLAEDDKGNLYEMTPLTRRALWVRRCICPRPKLRCMATWFVTRLRRHQHTQRLRSLAPWTQHEWDRLEKIFRPGKPSGIDFLLWHKELTS